MLQERYKEQEKDDKQEVQWRLLKIEEEEEEEEDEGEMCLALKKLAQRAVICNTERNYSSIYRAKH